MRFSFEVSPGLKKRANLQIFASAVKWLTRFSRKKEENLEKIPKTFMYFYSLFIFHVFPNCCIVKIVLSFFYHGWKSSVSPRFSFFSILFQSSIFPGFLLLLFMMMMMTFLLPLFSIRFSYRDDSVPDFNEKNNNFWLNSVYMLYSLLFFFFWLKFIFKN